MKNFYKSNTFLVIISIITAILIWIYVVYEVNPMYETWINDIPIGCTNTSSAFDDGSLVIMGENKNLIKNGVTMDIRVRGKRSVVSSLTKNNFTCSVDMLTVTRNGIYTLKPYIESEISGLEILKTTPYSLKIKVENIEQKDFAVDIKTAGTVPDGYSVDNVINHNETVKITGAGSVIDSIKRVEAVLDYDTIDVKSTETAAKIFFYDAEGNEVDPNSFKKTVEYAKLTFELHTAKEVTVLLVPKYKDEINKNRQGESVKLAIEGGNPDKDGGGIEIKVKLIGSNVAIEKYSDSIRTVYTEEIDVRGVTKDMTFDGIKAAELSGSVEFASVPEVNVKAIIDRKKE